MSVASFIKFSVDPRLGVYLLDSKPAVLWNEKASKIVWGNPAAASLFGGHDVFEIMARRYKDQTFARPHLRRMASEAKLGVGALSRLRFSFGLKTLALTCMCTAIERKGQRYLLMVSLEPVSRLDEPADIAGQLMNDLDAQGAPAALLQSDEQDWNGSHHLVEALDGHADTDQLHDASSGTRYRHALADLPPCLRVLQLQSATGPFGTLLVGLDTDNKISKWQPLPLLVKTPVLEPESVASEIAPSADLAGEDPQVDDDHSSTDIEPVFDTAGEQTTESPDNVVKTASTTESEDEADAPSSEQSFAPSVSTAAVRFVWRSDANHIVTSVSPDLREAVGSESANIIGQSWQDIAADYPLDPQDVLIEALNSQDTWSGIDVTWPVSGSDYRVPISLSAMPIVDATRSFQGYRGFGMIRQSAAFQSGLFFGPTPQGEDDAPEDGSDLESMTVSDETAASADDNSSEKPKAASTSSSDDQAWSADKQAENSKSDFDDLPAYERVSPPSNILPFETSNSEQGDKTAEKVSADALSPQDRTALSEIARKLGGRVSFPGDSEDDGNESSPESDESETTGEYDLADMARRHNNDADIFEQSPTNIDDNEPADDVQDPDDLTADEAIEEPADDPVLPSAATLLEMPTDALLRIFRRLPLPVLVFQHGHTLVANPQFLALTGYADAASFDDAGGLENLFSDEADFVPPIDESTNREGVWISTESGDRIRVDAVLQSLRIDDEQVFALTLAKTSDQIVEIDEIEVSAIGGVAKLSLDDELEDILNTATDGVLILDQDGNLLGLNASAEALFGIRETDVLGGKFAELLAEESRSEVADYLDGLARNGVISVLNDGREVIALESNGGMIPIFMTIGVVGQGDSQKYCAVLRDITSWKKAEEELTAARRHAELANAQKSDFLAKVSHEIRTPLNGVIGFAEIMAEERFGPMENERYKQYVDDIKLSGEHIMELVNDLLDLSKIEAGKLDLTFAAVSTNDILGECVALLQPRANRDRVIIRSSLSSNLPKVVADSKSLRQVVLNLLSNAVKFTSPGGQVIVSSTQSETGEVVLRIRDTGVGMSEDDLKTALEPFRQLETSRPAEAGTGLGLPLSKALVEANRAAFEIESEVGRGTMVKISFPVQRVLAE